MEIRPLTRATTIYIAVLVIGCGDNTSACPHDEMGRGLGWPTCAAALIFAARDTTELVPSQPEVDRYYDRWDRAQRAEPILARRGPKTYRWHSGLVAVWTTNARVIAAWTLRSIETGDSSFDSIIAELNPQELNSFWRAHDDGSYSFLLKPGAFFNEEQLARALLATSSSLKEPEYFSGDDGVWRWINDVGTETNDATAQIDFTFGWGDCFVACFGYRTVRAIVPSTGDATVYDLGGDPLPDYLSLSPNTIPLAQ